MTTPEAKPAADAGPISTGFLDGRSRARVKVPPATIAPLGYLTPQDEFGDVERGNPLPYTLPPDDPHFERADWRDADILPPPERWGGGLPDGRLPGTPVQFDPATGTPRQWPMRYTVAPWAAVLCGVAPGRYELRCRTIDLNGIAQPMPRPFPKSGRAAIQHVSLVVEE